MGTQTEAVFTELLAELAQQQRRLVDQLSGPGDEQSLLEAHKWLLTILQVATDTQVWADTARPRFTEIVGPYKKWGGDNADAFYLFAPVDPARTYRVRVRRGDAVYLSLSVYGGPDDGRYSERIVGSLNDRQAPPDPDGVIDMVLSPEVISEAVPHMGYLHRCAEKIGENVTPIQYIPYTDRMDYLAGMNMNLGYSLAVEKLCAMKIPEKAQVIRVIIASLRPCPLGRAGPSRRAIAPTRPRSAGSGFPRARSVCPPTRGSRSFPAPRSPRSR